MSKARDIADLDFNSPDIDGGSIDGAVIGGTTPAGGTFNSLTVDGSLGDWSVNSEGARMHFSRPSANYINASDEAGYLVFQTSNGETALTLNTAKDAYFSNVVNVAGRDGAETVFNDGSTTANFRVETNDNPNMLVVHGANNQVMIGTNSPLDANNYGLYARSGLLIGNFSGTGNGLTVYRGASLNTNISHDSTKGFVSTAGHGLHFRTSLDSNYKISMNTDGVVINEAGNDYDFRVESEDSVNMLKVDGALNQVQITGDSGNSDSALLVTNNYNNVLKAVQGDTSLSNNVYTFMVDSSSHTSNMTSAGAMRVETYYGDSFKVNGMGATIINDAGVASGDFRARSLNNTHALFVDAGNDHVGVFNANPRVALDIEGSTMPETNDAASVEDMLTLYRYGSPSVWSGGATFALGRYASGGSSNPRSRLDIKLKDAGGSNTALPESPVMTLQSNGAVGINETSPGAMLHVSDATNINMSASAEGQVRVEGNGYSGAIALNGDAMQIYHNSSSRGIVFGTNEQERVRITDAGQLVTQTGAVINESGVDSDFRVESNNHAHALFVDASEDSVSIKFDNSYGSTLQVQGAIGTVNGHNDLVSVTNSIGSLVTNGEISHTIGFSGTYGSGRTFTWTYNSTSWKAFRVRLEVGSTAGFAVFEGGGYNNNGLTQQVIEHDGNNVGTFTITNNGQTNSYRLTLNKTHIHPYFKFVLGQSGGDSFPRLSNLSLVQA